MNVRTARWALAIALAIGAGVTSWYALQRDRAASALPQELADDGSTGASNRRAAVASEPKRPPHAARDSTYEELQRAAQRGDPTAALRVAEGREACLRIAGLEILRDGSRSALREAAAKNQDTTELEHAVAAHQAGIAALQTHCLGEHNTSLAELHELWARAARLGSPEAQYEYAINPRLNPLAPAKDLERWREWRDHSPGYLAARLESGDGRAALALAAASAPEMCTPNDAGPDDPGLDPCGAGSLLSMIVPHDVAAAYRYYLLARDLDGGGNSAVWSDGQLQRFAAQLSVEEIAAARALAQQQLAQIPQHP